MQYLANLTGDAQLVNGYMCIDDGPSKVSDDASAVGLFKQNNIALSSVVSRRCSGRRHTCWSATLRRQRSTWKQVLFKAGAAVVSGQGVECKEMYSSPGSHRTQAASDATASVDEGEDLIQCMAASKNSPYMSCAHDNRKQLRWKRVWPCA